MEAEPRAEPSKSDGEKYPINYHERVIEGEGDPQHCKGDIEGDSGVSPITENVDRRYPYIPLFFIMANAALQNSFVGVQAILELFFARFLFVCSSVGRAKSLSTVCVNVFIALSQLSALSGGLIAEWFLGNFHTQNVSNILATTGIVLVMICSWQFSISEPSCCVNATLSLGSSSNSSNGGISDTLLYLADTSGDHGNCSELKRHLILPDAYATIPSSITIMLILVGLALYAFGFGQSNAIQSVFVGDQFPEGDSKEKERSFSWYYLWLNVGSLASEGGLPVLRQSVGFVITMIISTGCYGLSMIVFFIGWCFYVKKKPHYQLCKGCCTTAHTSREEDIASSEVQPLVKSGANYQAPHTTSHRKTKWDRETRKQLLRISGVYTPLIVFWAIFYQQNSTWVLQGTQMDCYIGNLHIPPDMMPSVNDILVIAIIPVLDYVVYPHLKKSLGITVKPLHKITAGMVAAALSFLFAFLLQMYLDETESSCHGRVSIAWQIPQLLLISFAEVLVTVTGLEFAYSQSPSELRPHQADLLFHRSGGNLVKALWCIIQALGTLLNALIALIAMKLLYEFLSYTALMSVVVCMFVAINWNFKYRNY